MSEATTNVTGADDLNPPTQQSEPTRPERVPVAVAIGPNTEGVMDQVRAAHTRELEGHVPPPPEKAPDPANVDDTGEFAEAVSAATPQPQHAPTE